MLYLVICNGTLDLFPRVNAPRLCCVLHTEHSQPGKGGGHDSALAAVAGLVTVKGYVKTLLRAFFIFSELEEQL